MSNIKNVSKIQETVYDNSSDNSLFELHCRRLIKNCLAKKIFSDKF